MNIPKNKNAFTLIEFLIALSLSVLLCAGIFSLFNTLQNLNRRQMITENEYNQTQFINAFLREKIHMAGNNSCVSASEKHHSIAVHDFDTVSAKQLLGLTIKPGTQLLQLNECIRLHDQFQYLPVAFFIADTHRMTPNKKNINALFIKLGDHPREELVTGMTDFQLHLYYLSHDKNNIQGIEINFLLSSVDNVLKNPQIYWFNGESITASDRALYQPGILYAAVQDQLS